jgi:hypothetical protein
MTLANWELLFRRSPWNLVQCFILALNFSQSSFALVLPVSIYSSPVRQTQLKPLLLLLYRSLLSMVYCGKPSKACAECRLRRTKVKYIEVFDNRV